VTEPPAHLSHREPIFNVPRVVIWLLAAFVAVHVVRYILPEYQTGSHGMMDVMVGSPWLTWAVAFLPDSTWLTALLAFIPARLGGLADELPGGHIAIFSSFVTHLFVHGDLMHLLVNSAWLLAFATAVARRTDTLRFLLFFLLAGAAGALFFTAVNGFKLTMLVGASGAISGLMGASFRFIFGSDEHGVPRLARAERAPLMSLADTLRDRRIMMAVAGWVVLNVVVAWGAAASLTEAAGIAWEAHIGGFAVGLLTYGYFDRPAEHPTDDNAADAV
jgi:membrane associated rhomboid family serine protease